MKKNIENVRWEGSIITRYRINQKVYTEMTFDNLVVKNAIISDCLFEKCDFKNSYLGFNVKYINCIWKDCKFHGKYNSIGGKSSFINCEFSRCLFKSTDISGSKFKKCKFSGSFQNMIIRNAKNKKVEFTKCDLGKVEFVNINLYSGIDVSSIILPKQSIRIFKNGKSVFSIALRAASQKLSKDDSIPLSVLGNSDCFDKQNPVIFDISTITEILNTDKSKEEFEDIALKYEIR